MNAQQIKRNYSNPKFASTEAFKKYKGKNPLDYTTFHERIACLRVNYKTGNSKTGLSLTVAAERIGVSIHQLRMMELGERSNPRASTVCAMESFYKQEPGSLAKLLRS
jgi:hypothetical protein